MNALKNPYHTRTSMITIIARQKITEHNLEKFGKLELLVWRVLATNLRTDNSKMYIHCTANCIGYYANVYVAELPWKEE